MKITIKAGGWVRRHLPGDPADNQAEVEVAEGATPEGVIAQLALPTDDHYAVEINGTLVPRAEHGSRALAASDVHHSARAQSRHVRDQSFAQRRSGTPTAVPVRAAASQSQLCRLPEAMSP